MEFITKHYSNLSDNYKRLITLIGSTILAFTVLFVFPLNILMVYTIIRAYSKNNSNLFIGMRDEFMELYQQLKNLRKADSLQSLEKDEVSEDIEDIDNTSNDDFTEEDTIKATELTSITAEDIPIIHNTVELEPKVDDLKKDD